MQNSCTKIFIYGISGTHVNKYLNVKYKYMYIKCVWIQVQEPSTHLCLIVVFRCRKWLVNCRRKDLDCHMKKLSHLRANYRLCSDHFEESQFMNMKTKDRLTWNAVPTLFEVPNPPHRLQSSHRSHRGIHPFIHPCLFQTQKSIV